MNRRDFLTFAGTVGLVMAVPQELFEAAPDELPTHGDWLVSPPGGGAVILEAFIQGYASQSRSASLKILRPYIESTIIDLSINAMGGFALWRALPGGEIVFDHTNSILSVDVFCVDPEVDWCVVCSNSASDFQMRGSRRGESFVVTMSRESAAR